jgi:hypothetical protein
VPLLLFLDLARTPDRRPQSAGNVVVYVLNVLMYLYVEN